MTRVKQIVFASVVVLAVWLAFAPPATAGYMSYCGVTCESYPGITSSGGVYSVGSPIGFTKLGSAWDPGPGTARVGGDPSPGGATWSVMAAGKADSGFGFDPHGGAFTSALLALYGGGVDEATTVGIR